MFNDYKVHDLALETLGVNAAVRGKFSSDGNALVLFLPSLVANVLLNVGQEGKIFFKRWLDISGPVFDLAFRPSPSEVEAPTHEVAFCRFRQRSIERRDLELRFDPHALDLRNTCSLSFDRTGQKLLAGTKEGAVALFSLGDFPELRFSTVLSFVDAEIIAAAISGDEKYIFATTKAGEYFICDWKEGNYWPLIRDPASHSPSTRWQSPLLVTHPDRPLVAFVHSKRAISVIDTAQSRIFFGESADGKEIVSLGFSPEGLLYTATASLVELYSMPVPDDAAAEQSLKLVKTFFAAAGRRIVTACVCADLVNMATLPLSATKQYGYLAVPLSFDDLYQSLAEEVLSR